MQCLKSEGFRRCSRSQKWTKQPWGSRYLKLGFFRPNSGGHFPFPGLRPSNYFQLTASLAVTRHLTAHICSVGEGWQKPKCNALYSKGLSAVKVLCHTGVWDRIMEKEDP